MCGIAGFAPATGWGEEAPALIRRMAGLMSHRDPDDERVHVTPHVALGFRRLAVIDLVSGAQPMSSPDGRYWIVLNGEIYNYREIRRDLTARGATFRTQSDTEVLLALFAADGDPCLERLDGMFAFAIWDSVERRLLLARDRLGKKPLFYAVLPKGGIAFASEVNALRVLPGIDADVDPEALNLYLAYQYVPHPRSIYRGVKKLPPAHTLRWTPGQSPVLNRYWSLDCRRKRGAVGDGDLIEELRDLLRAAVRRRLASDVPLGAFLSGGIDSSAVVAFMCEAMGKVKTFTVGFEERGFSESPEARAVAEHFGTEHHEFIVRPDAAALLPKMARYYGEPFADCAALPTFCLAEATRPHVTVALSGDGGDEAFAGYPRYRWLSATLRAGRALQVVPGPLRMGARSLAPRSSRIGRGVRRFLAEEREPYALWNEIWYCPFTLEDRLNLYTPGIASSLADPDVTWLQSEPFSGALADDPVERAQLADMAHHLPDQLLVKMDVATMAHGLEVRSPLLDHHIFEWVAALPASVKRPGRIGKRLLRGALAGILPAETLRKPKHGFSVPVDAWLRGSARSLVTDALLGLPGRGRGYFRQEVVERMVREHVEGSRNHGQRLWILLALELWHEASVDSARQEPSA
jgi:asparagine synthase (glutamine-hydrolysing)